MGFKKENAAMPSMEHLRAWVEAAREKEMQQSKGSSAVLVPIILREDGYHVLYEVRAAKLNTQPGEICFPGGRIEPGEDPEESAVREVMEELLIDRDQIEIVAELGRNAGPGGVSLYSFLGVLHDYEGTWSRAEVDYVFTLPLDWILQNDPVIYRIELVRNIPEDFPFDKVPYGRDYHWRKEFNQIPFYPELRHGSRGSREEEGEAPAAPQGSSASADSAAPQGSSASADSAAPAGSSVSLALSGSSEPLASAGSKERAGAAGPAEAVGVNEALPEEMPVLWGATARVTYAMAQFLRLAEM